MGVIKLQEKRLTTLMRRPFRIALGMLKNFFAAALRIWLIWHWYKYTTTTGG
jgi:hypothetical protein